MKRYSILLMILVAAIAVTSGCVGQQQSPAILAQTNGVVIKNLDISPPADQLLSGEPIIITADMENIGSATARNVVVELIGASWFGGTLANYGNADEEGDGIAGTTLTPPDPRYGLLGQTKSVEFRLPAPMLPEGQKASYELKLRVKYDYESSAVAQIKGYSRERYNSLYQQGKLSPPVTASIPVQVSKNAPVTIALTGPDKFVVGPLYEEYTYQLTFRNVGGNLPITRSYPDNKETDGLILGTIWVQGPGVYFKRCLGVAPETLYNNMPNGLNNFFTSLKIQYQDKFSAWYENTPWGDAWGVGIKIGNVYIGGQSVPKAPTLNWPSYVIFPNAISWEVMGFLMDPIMLRRGESVTKSCTIGIVNDPAIPAAWADRTEDSMILNAHLKYRYFVDQVMSITVAAPIVRTPFTP